MITLKKILCKCIRLERMLPRTPTSCANHIISQQSRVGKSDVTSEGYNTHTGGAVDHHVLEDQRRYVPGGV